VEVKVQQPVVEAPEQQQQQKEQQQETSEEDMLDYTKIPVLMDSTFEAVDSDNCMKAAILKLDATWSLKHASSLLEEPKACTLDVAAQTKARDAAFDLLDALSRSGDLPMEHSELHVVIPVTHVFTDSVINTVVRQNVNPIEKVERSVLIMASITQQKPVKSLVLEQHHTRLLEYSPSLFLEGTPLLQ
jgi:hypothetical protein